ncbi:hypothetical protein ONZ45_g6337 [Pleurotus djamor]|nr:hypothetical protein ONZ45_g6337 [Pleurotus djamor]
MAALITSGYMLEDLSDENSDFDPTPATAKKRKASRAVKQKPKVTGGKGKGKQTATVIEDSDLSDDEFIPYQPKDMEQDEVPNHKQIPPLHIREFINDLSRPGLGDKGLPHLLEDYQKQGFKRGSKWYNQMPVFTTDLDRDRLPTTQKPEMKKEMQRICDEMSHPEYPVQNQSARYIDKNGKDLLIYFDQLDPDSEMNGQTHPLTLQHQDERLEQSDGPGNFIPNGIPPDSVRRMHQATQDFLSKVPPTRHPQLRHNDLQRTDGGDPRFIPYTMDGQVKEEVCGTVHLTQGWIQTGGKNKRSYKNLNCFLRV